MGKRKTSVRGHTGKTATGNTRDVKVDRIGRVTIYKRGESYSLYYRESGKSVRYKIDGNLAVAKATAAQVHAALVEGRRSPISFERTSPDELQSRYLDHVAVTQQLALRTRDRYRAALDRFVEFCHDAGIKSIDLVDIRRVEDFVRWLRGQTRTRNGARSGMRAAYQTSGIKFILSCCRTAFRWAARHGMLPPSSGNPLSEFAIDRLGDREAEEGPKQLLSTSEETAFFKACGEWQTPIFRMLVTYGLRVGELTHLLVDDVDLSEGIIHIRSKPWMFWTVKTRRQRQLPIIGEMERYLAQRIGSRRAGFVFLNEASGGRNRIPHAASSPDGLRRHLCQIASEIEEADPDQRERKQRKAVSTYCRSIGQIPEKRIREEYIKLTMAIGRPDLTRVHDLRHLFASRAQAAGMNPLIVQELLGHTTLEMTRAYSHFAIDAKRDAMAALGSPVK